MHLAFASLLKDASTESKFLSTTSIMNKDLWAIRNVLDHQFGDDFFDDWAQDAITDFAKHPITVPAYLLHAFLQTTLMLGGDPSSPSDSSFLGFEFKVPAGSTHAHTRMIPSLSLSLSCIAAK